MAGGRPVGSTNKNGKFLLNRLQEMYGESFHPVMQMAKNADSAQRLVEEYEDDPERDAQTLFAGYKFAVDAWDKVASYTEPKLKAIDHSGNISTRPMLVDLSGGKLTEANQDEEG